MNMKKSIFIAVFFLVSAMSFGQVIYEVPDTTQFNNIDTITVTTDVIYNAPMCYEGDGVTTTCKAKFIEKREKPIVNILRFNADKTKCFLGYHKGKYYIYKVYHKYNKIILEQEQPISSSKTIIIHDLRYGNREIIHSTF